jgi:hypothetical protein
MSSEAGMNGGGSWPGPSGSDGYPEPDFDPYAPPTAQPYPPPTAQPYAQPYPQPGAQPYPQPYPQPSGQEVSSPYASSYPATPYGAAPGYTFAPQHPLGVASLITGIAGLVLGFVCGVGFLAGPVALGLALTGRKQMREQPGRWSATNTLTAGLVIGAVGTAFLVGGVIIAVWWFVVAAGSVSR